MSDSAAERKRAYAPVQVSRTIVVRLGGVLDPDAVAQLRRILRDLIVDQGVGDLLIDLSSADDIGSDVADVLRGAQSTLQGSGGRLELRLPAAAPASVLKLAREFATFLPVELDPPSS